MPCQRAIAPHASGRCCFRGGSSCRKNDRPDQRPVSGARVRQRTEPGNLETIRFASTSVVKAASSSAIGQAARRLSAEDFPVRRSAKRSKEIFCLDFIVAETAGSGLDITEI